jgi:recombinational DNA repair protein RecT
MTTFQSASSRRLELPPSGGRESTSGEAQIRVCFRKEIEESKAASRGSHKPDSPWRNHYEAMALVVPIRKMGSNLGLPLRVEEFDNGVNFDATKTQRIS